MLGRRSIGLGVAALLLCFQGCFSSAEDAGGIPIPTGMGGGVGFSTTATTGPGTGGGGLHGPDLPFDPSGGYQGQTAEGGKEPDAPMKICSLDKYITYGMSADDSNSMGSPGYARAMLDAKKAPDPALIRTYEFLNYYRIGYVAAAPGSLTIIPSLLKSAEIPGEYRLQIGVQAPLPDSPRRPMTVTLVVDTSQSMAGAGIMNARAVVHEIAQSLQTNDRVSIVTLDADAPPVLDGQVIKSDDDNATVDAFAEELFVGGGSNLQGGLVRGYSLAYQHFMKGGLNRLVLITDGRTNPTEVSPAFIAEHAKQGEDQGIFLVGVGTGEADGYNDELLDTLTDFGRGAYVFIDSKEEAQHIFSDRFSEVMDIGARSVSVKVALPDYLGIQQYYGEEYQTDLANATPQPQHLGAGDAMIFNMALASTCSNGLYNGEDLVKVRVDWKTPLALEPKTTTIEASLDSMINGNLAPIRKGVAVVAYAEALKSLDAARLKAAYKVVEDAYNAGGMKDKDLADIMILIANHPVVEGSLP